MKGKTEKAYFAGGCFWGVEYHFQKIKGVISAISGYMGGSVEKPTYEDVCAGDTGHAETVEVTYDSSVVTYEKLAMAFFEIHDPTQKNGQGPDIGYQYRSVVFYANKNQKETAEKLIKILKSRGLDVATAVVKAKTFWKAEEYHQQYYSRKHGTPYCHVRVKRF